MMNMKKINRSRSITAIGWGVAACSVGVLVASMTATAASADPDIGNSFGNAISSKVAPDVFVTAQAEFPEALPQGVSWPESLPAPFLEDGVGMQANVPRAVASLYWKCAWEDSYIAASRSGDADSAKAALGQLSGYVDLPFYKEQVEDPDGLWSKLILEPAQAGDASGVVADFSAGCEWYAGNQK
jgi:hypothetical protein